MAKRRSICPLLAILAASTALGVSAPAVAEAQHAGSAELGLFGGFAWLSSTSELGNAFGNNSVPGNAPLVGARAGYHLNTWLAFEGEARWTFAKFRSGIGSSPVLGYRGQLLASLPNDSIFQPFVLLGVGAETLMASELPFGDRRDTDPVYQAGIGSRVLLADNFGLRVDLRYLSIRDRQQDPTGDVELHAGLFWALGGTPVDRDGDGIADRKDKCPDQAETKNGFEDTDGCPDDPDSDGDGLVDSKDKCPQVPENMNAFEDTDGCPDDPDTDGDGISDSKDKCPKVAENKNGFEDADGCPDDPDTDGDGIVDSQDKCPKQPETKNGFQDADGCPDVLDTDGDGFADDKDKCPKEPETKNGFEDDDGCPDKVPEKLRKFTGAIKGIEFDVDKATIKPSSFPTLDNAVAVLAEFKDTKIEVSGHTDNSGDPQHNKDLSLARASAVKDYFVGKGIAAERILTVGHGPDKPVADNKTKAGKAKNRRIEFKLM